VENKMKDKGKVDTRYGVNRVTKTKVPVKRVTSGRPKLTELVELLNINPMTRNS
jgi:hypothetical protein